MSIKLLARDVYKAHQKVDKARKAYEQSSPAERDTLKAELLAAEKELQLLKKMLAGEKDSGSFRSRFDEFQGARR